MAYNRYQYETSPRKLQPVYEPQKKKYPKTSTGKKVKSKTNNTSKKAVKQNKKEHKKTVLYVGIAFAILFTISYRNAIISENFKQTNDLKTKLATMQKENEQLEVNIESSLNLKNIENVAKTELGMSKLDSSKTVYINLPREDHVETASEEVQIGEDKNWFEEIIDSIINLFK